MGDPAGVGPAITIAAWKALRNSPEHAFYVIGAPELYSPHVPVAEIDRQSGVSSIFPDALPILGAPGIPPITPGVANPDSATWIIDSIKQAVGDATAQRAAAVVTNPINKALLYSVGFKHPGHTEFIADICGETFGAKYEPVMMLTGGGLRVALATIHIPLITVPDHLSREKLVQLGQIVDKALRVDFSIAEPRIAFTGLNPHAGESGAIGREEIEIINPAAETLRQAGVNISDARSADTVFAEALDGRFDAVITMTHDQGLIPVKTLDMWGGVNMTLGLPIVRTSPDHGTGYDAAAAGTARPDSLISAIKQAALVARNRAVAS